MDEKKQDYEYLRTGSEDILHVVEKLQSQLRVGVSIEQVKKSWCQLSLLFSVQEAADAEYVRQYVGA